MGSREGVSATKREIPDVRHRLLELVEERIDELVERIVGRALALANEDEAYSVIPAAELSAAAEGLARAAVSGLFDGRPPTDDELELAALLGERRARQNVPLEQVLRLFRLGARDALEMVQDVAAIAGLDATATVDLAVDLWDWIDAVSVAVTDAHHRVELVHARQDQQQRASFVHGLIRGTHAASQIGERAAAFGLEASASHLIVRARPTAEHGANEIERLLLPSVWSSGLAALVEDDVVAVLPQAPAGELPVAAGVGPAVSLTALPRSFRDATRALATALAFGRTGCRSLDDDVLRAAVLAEDELSELLFARYVSPVRALGAFGDELLHSVRTFLEHEQNVEEAAGELFVHPNTLRHRLARFEETTGATLRNCEQLTEIWWALTREQAALSSRATAAQAPPRT